eukprot:CAMPEP_0184694000 /NCGR_PEP_ID=MMETSP0313-20130426/2080_1 /TAXON_ID=2792 /ORGANISM="Porphyridium aerugineum, Strain SAG 1380-2" /LENGTH=299 /DNA_ID=CAMNT_0027152205 /DNA_START=126 /DNA_END=1025 /DNA_ORIENTATION=+
MREIGVIIAQLGQTMVNYAEEIAAQIVTHQQLELTKVGGGGIMGIPQLGLTNLAALGQNNASNQQQANMLMATNMVPNAGAGAGARGMAAPVMNGKSPAKKRKAQGDTGVAVGAVAGGTSSSDARDGHEDKKQRIHWTEEENQLVFRIITENPAKDEKEIIEMLKVALAGSNRTPAQFKNHLKNLVKNGKLGITEGSTYIVNATQKAATPSTPAAPVPTPAPVAATTTTPVKGAKAEKEKDKDKDKAKAAAAAPNAASSAATTTPAKSAAGKGEDKKDVASSDAGKNGGGRRGGKKALQ